MSFDQDDFEAAYDLLADAITEAGEDHERLFLAKLALTLCHKLGDLDQIREAITIAAADLAGPRENKPIL